jgi:16S rRNA (cytosine967-C5)-methyltransferase
MQIASERDERVERLVGKVDRVLVDAPCTGSGTLRRHPDLKWRQNDASLAALVASQRTILAAAARLGEARRQLVYATCSVLAAEGEDVADDFERAAAAPSSASPPRRRFAAPRSAGAESLVEGERLRLWTHRHATDGFFAAVWQRA